MSSPRKIRFTGEIIAVSPMSITVFRDKTDRTPNYGIPMLTVTEESGGVSHVATVPGYNFKGALRRRALQVVRDALAKAGNDTAIDLEAYYLNAIGGVKGSEKEDVRNILRMRALRDANPILGLFGAATPHFMQGCLSVSFATAQPDCYELYNHKGVRVDDVRRRPALLTELAGDPIEEYATYVEDRAEVREQKGKVAAFAAKLAAARKAGDAETRATLLAEQDTEQKKLDEMSAESGAQIMRPIERMGVSPGAQFLQTMTLDSPTDAELGLMLAALKRFAASCRLGGLESIGFGQIKASWVIEEIDMTTLDKTRLGSIQISDCDFAGDISHPTLVRAADAWAEYSSAPEKIALTPAALEQVIAAR